MSKGYVYILVSPQTDCVKIGGTDYPPLKRIREINTTEPYKSLGPWTLADFRQVTDWRKVEANLHYTFRSKLNRNIGQQNELFHTSYQEVSQKLNELDPALIVSKPKIDRMFQDNEFSDYLVLLFKFTGLLNWLDIQGAWTFSLFPSTSGGRYFTINIGTHEVAYSTLPRSDDGPIHMVFMDNLIYDFPVVSKWLRRHRGGRKKDVYSSALPRSTSIHFSGTFEDASEFLSLDGVRRAMVAYWSEALIELKERNLQSVFGRFHNWNAIAEIRARAQ